MKNTVKLVSVILVLGIFVTSGFAFANDKQLIKKTIELIGMEKERDKFIEKREKPPKQLEDKIEFERQLVIQNQENIEKCEKEVKEKEEKIKLALKDKKGNPILHEHAPKKQKRNPHPDAGFIGDAGHGETFYPTDYKKYNFISTIITPYNILISGSIKENGICFIRNIKNNPEDDSKTEYLDSKYSDKKEIIFKGLTKNDTIVLFTYNDGKNGYYDLQNDKVVFEEYLEK